MLIPIAPLTDFNMKISEMVEVLEDYKERYGDCQIWADAGYSNVLVRMDVKDENIGITAVSYKL